MTEKLALIVPEIVLFIATCLVMITGQWPSRVIRDLTPWIAAVALFIAGMIATTIEPTGGLLPNISPYAKAMIAFVGLLLLVNLSGTVDRDLERAVDRGKPFVPIRSNRGEFFAFFLFSMTGLMLTASADDLIWLFLALELTSLPTYIMVAISTQSNRSHEASVKYFFLGALGAAIFLYGFALIYGATGSTDLAEIAAVFARDGLGALGLAGVLVALLGLCFKIAAFPMHFYTPDVYQGAAAPVGAMLAFVPKAAGFLGIIALAAAVGWNDRGHLPQGVESVLWIVAALTMTVGNVLALLQNSVKRLLAYSSIAHSGYMLVGIVAGPGAPDAPFYRNGIAAVLFYLAVYGVMSVGVFAALGALETRREGEHDTEDADDIEGLRGLCATRPVLGWTVILASLSLLGFPPLLGFVGKLGLFAAGISAGQIALVVVLGINSAIAAVYYLRLVSVVYLDAPGRDRPSVTDSPHAGRRIAGVLSAAGVIVLLAFAQPIADAARDAATIAAPAPSERQRSAGAEDPADPTPEHPIPANRGS